MNQPIASELAPVRITSEVNGLQVAKFVEP